MAILMQCTCGTKLSVDDSLAGKKTRCPRCQAILVAPARTAPVPPVVEPKASAPMPMKNPSPPKEEPIMGLVLGLDDEVPTRKLPADEEPILGIVLDPPRPRMRAAVDEEPVPTVAVDRKRPANKPRKPQPAPIWPWVVGGVTGACLLIGVVITLVIVLNDSGDRRIVKEGKKEAKKDPFWGQKRGDVKKEEAEKDPFWDAKKEGWPKDRFEEKKGWPGDDKKGEDKFVPFRPVQPIMANLANGKYQYVGQMLPEDRTAPNDFGKIFMIRLQAQRTYTIDLVSNQFDPILWLQGNVGQQLAFADNGVGDRPSSIKYKISTSGVYKIIAAPRGGARFGAFTLTVREDGNGEAVPVAKLPDLQLPKSTSPKQALAVQSLFNNQATVTRVLSADLVGDMCWSKDGKAFFALQRDGVLRRIALAGFMEERRLETARRCSCLAMSAEGLLVTLPDLGEAWLMDPESLEVKKRLSAPKVNRVISAPTLAIAVALGDDQRFDPLNRGGLTVLDLKKGEPVAQFRLPGRHATISPDGSFLFAQGGIEQLQRIRIEGKQLIQEDASPRIAQNGQGIFVSPDSKYVCLPSGGGNYHIAGAPSGSYATYVFTVDNLRQPAFTVPSGAYPQVVGFDPKGGHVFAQDFKTALMIFDFKGQKKKEITLDVQGREVKQYLAHPDGGKLLLRSDKQVLFVDLSGRKLDPIVQEGSIKLRDGMAQIEGRLTMDSQKKFGKAQQEFTVEMLSGREYTLTMNSKYVTGSLLLLDAETKQQVSGVTGFAGKDARCLFRPTKAGTYTIRIINRTFNAIVEGKSDFTLTIQEKLIPVGTKDPPDPRLREAIKLIDGKFETQGRISDNKPVFGKTGKEFLLETRAGFDYWIEMKSENFGSFVWVRDVGGKPLMAGGSTPFTKMIFRPQAPGTYKILASVKRGSKAVDGTFTLTINERTAAKVELPMPPGEIVGKPEVEDGLSIRRLLLDKTRPQACWDDEGKFLFTFDQVGGTLSRIRAADFVLEASAKHPRVNSFLMNLNWSAQGPVLTDGPRLLLIDRETLALKKLFKPPASMFMFTSPGASVALGIQPVSGLRKRNDILFDLKELTERPLSGWPLDAGTGLSGKLLSVDGRYFFLIPRNGKNVLQRYRLKDGILELEEETKVASGYPITIAQRQDGKYVAAYCSSGFVPEIFESNRLVKPAFTLPGTTKALCFLQPGGHILAYSGRQLELFSETGAKIKSFPWPRLPIVSLIPHPTRPAAIAVTFQQAYYVELTDLKIVGK